MGTPKDRPARTAPRLPRGFRDRFGPELIAERETIARIAAVYEAWGFDPLETPALEYTEALGKFLPDVERPNSGVFSLQDDDEAWLSLRYDLTAPLARFAAAHYDALPKPFRRYAMGPVWRNEKPGPGRYRQFVQIDADTVGAPAPEADVDSILTLAEALCAAGLSRDDFTIRYSDRRALSGLLEALGIEDAETRLRTLRALDKRDRLGTEGVAALLGPGRRDESGDFTEGAGLGDAAIARALAFGASEGDDADAACARLADAVGHTEPGAQAVETLEAMAAALAAAGLDRRAAQIDASVVRGLEYYTGPVFEADLNFETVDDKGRPVRFGSVASGGRYDGLVARFRSQPAPAVGFSVGVSRLTAALEARASAAAQAPRGPVLVLALEADRMADYRAMAAELRAAGLRAEVYLGGSGMRAQLKYADKRGAPVAVICGEDERARGVVTVKDLALGAKLSEEIEDNAEWREARVAQREVPRAALAETVAATLCAGRPQTPDR